MINAGLGTGKFVRAVRPLGNGGRPNVAFYDEVNGDLRLASCSDFSCSFATGRVLVSNQNFGQDIAMVINPATGFALISFYRADIAGSLFVYVCAAAACATGTVQTWDAAPTGDRGHRSALAFGTNLANFTNSFVVYENTQTGELKYGRSMLPFSNFGSTELAIGTDPARSSTGVGGQPSVLLGPNSQADKSRPVRACSFPRHAQGRVFDLIFTQLYARAADEISHGTHRSFFSARAAANLKFGSQQFSLAH